MSAGDALSPQQFVNHNQLRAMYSGDFDVPMSKVLPEMRDFGHPSLDEFIPGTQRSFGTTDRYVNYLAKDIAKNGMQKPITVRGGNVVKDGHHRALAAMKLRMREIPVRLID